MTIDPPLPRLLVSVRDADEAVAALRGGADIIDVKEPTRGPLGRADVDVVKTVVRAVQSNARNVVVSVALGESHETGVQTDFVIPDGVAFAKLGLSGLAGNADWAKFHWMVSRSAFEQASGTDVRWVAVIYADGGGCPPALDVIHAARETGCVGVLIDTFDKQTGGLLSHVDVGQLSASAERCRQLELFFAVAGRLTIDDLQPLVAVRPDIVAIRSAACENSNRRQRVSAKQVRTFRDALHTAVPARRIGGIH